MRVLLIIVFVCCAQLAAAQELIKTTTETAETNVSERVRLLESELERQNNKLDQLQKTIAEQQLAIQALLEKLNAHPAASASSVTPVKETEPVKAEPEPQTTAVEKRLDKVESDIKKFGPIRLSGDFRLRFDGIFHVCLL